VLMPERQLDTRFLGAMAWTPTGDHLLVGGQQGERIFLDTDTWDETNRLALETTQLALFDFAIHPDGRRLYASSEAGRVWVIDLTTIEIEGDPLDASGTQLQEIAISPNGVYVAAISRDGALRTWETESRRSVGPAMIGHAFAARGLEWGPDGPVSLGMDGAEPDGLGHFTVVEWNLAPNYLVEVACGLVGRNMSLAEWAEYVPGADYRPTCPNLPSP
jgi:WD40 repeat protein